MLLTLAVALALVGCTPKARRRSSSPRPTPVPPRGRAGRGSAAGFGALAGSVGGGLAAGRADGAGAIAPMPAALGTSRFGGAPDLPAGMRWPRCHGRPESFLGQVRVHDLPADARELRRVGGTLLFFTQVHLEPGEPDNAMWAGDCSAVIHARAGARLVRTAAPAHPLLALKNAPLRFRSRPDVPGHSLDADHLMAPLRHITPADGEQYDYFRDGLNGGPSSTTGSLASRSPPTAATHARPAASAPATPGASSPCSTTTSGSASRSATGGPATAHLAGRPACGALRAGVRGLRRLLSWSTTWCGRA